MTQGPLLNGGVSNFQINTLPPINATGIYTHRNQVTRLCVTKSPGQGLNINSPVQVLCFCGTQCGV
jgi:hypothetical protein